MKKIFLCNSISAVLVLLISSAAFADIHIKQKQEIAGRSVESVVDIKGSRQRSESEIVPGMKTISIMECDLKRTITINDGVRKYMITPMAGTSEASTRGSAIDIQTASYKPGDGGVVTYTIVMTDTGERKQMFGFTARHIKMTMSTDSSPDACQQTKMKIETDGWYIDLNYGLTCVTDNPVPPQTQQQSKPGCQDKIHYKRVGNAKTGYPLMLTTKMFDADGNESFTFTTEVEELSQTALDQSLFEIPAGYTEAKSQSEMYDRTAMAKAMMKGNTGGDSGNTESDSSSGRSSGPVSSKASGTIRIGVVGFENKTSESFSGDSVRDRLISAITGSGMDAVAINSKSPSDVTAEAKQKECDFVLYTDVTGLKQSSANKVGGLLGRAAGVGGGGKPRYESQIEFRLFQTGSDSPQTQSKANAKEDGDANVSLGAAVDAEAKTVRNAAKH